MSPDVSVRVLSLQTTVTEPSASTAASRRTSARRAAIRRSPIASAIVATAGSASGTAATASAIPICSTSAKGAPCSRLRPDATAVIAEHQPNETPSELVEPSLEGCPGFGR